MAQSVIVLVAALLITTLSYCSAENVYCVTPTAASCSSCPHNATNCTTLSEYSQEAELYFTSNTTMVFLPGDHTLDTNIIVANVARLTMCGESSSGNRATVVCSGSVGLSFTSMVDFKMQYLGFTACSRSSRYNSTIYLNVAVVLLQSAELSLVNCSFHNNFGNALFINNTEITLTENNFTHNYCESNSCVGGGDIIAVSSNLTFTGNTTFLENRANGRPGGIEMHNCNMNSTGSIYFINNSNSNGVGGAITAFQSSLNFTGASIFVGNFVAFAGIVGGAIYLQGSTMSFSGISNFHNNSGFGGGAISANSSAVSFNGTSSFDDNYGKLGGAICAVNRTKLTFNGTIRFSNNGYDKYKINLLGDNYGGGVYMAYSTISILPNTTVYWENNHAYLGGAIYIVDNGLSYCHVTYFTPPKREECFFQLPGKNLSNGIDNQLVFKNNSAHNAGSVLYGGAIDHCKLVGLELYSSGEVFNRLAHIEDENTTSNISSYPFRVCPCENNLPNCSKSVITRPIYPGETLTVSVVAVGQRNGTVPSRVIVHISHVHNSGDLYANVTAKLPNGSQHLQQTGNTCTKLNYTVLSLSNYTNKNLELYADDLCSTFSGTLIVDLNINQTCPPGFSLSETEASCVCEQRLQKYTNSCTITNGLGQITREVGEDFWVGYDDSDGLILNPICPFDYCVAHTVAISRNNTGVQCVRNRSGLLCGACNDNYSLVLGTFQCRKCTNSHLVLLIPFAVMGVALVFLLLVCKLTVATGTLSGLVFYANIVGANRTVFLPVESANAFSIFIAWLNLDFGIETCFYNGLDAYSKTWLQFVFPIYIWTLVGLIIVVSHFSDKFARLLGNNPVAVLATLILLSYTKILRTFTTAITFTYLEYPTYNRGVWLYDANIDYLSGKHIPLFLVAVLAFLVLFLPYTLLLLFGQWLQAISHLSFFSWVNRLKPFMDSYHAPYKAKHRYWPGLLLVLRFILFIVFAISFDPQQDTKVSLLIILVGAGVLFFWAWFTGGVYRNWCLDALEGSFVLNLTILTAATMYTNCLATDRSADRNYKQLAVGYTSVTIAFITFIVILAYHIFQQVKHTKLCKKLKLTDKKMSFQQDANNDRTSVAVANSPEVEGFTRLREPLLEDEPEHNYHTF